MPATLDPARAASADEMMVARALFATLVEFDAQGEPRPALAESWSVDDTARALVITMRQGLHFSDDAPLTAHDVVWSWQRALRSTTAAQNTKPLHVVALGAALDAGTILRAVEGAPLGPTPFSVFDPSGPPPAAAARAHLAPGTPVRVIDSNARRACCGAPIPLLAGTDTREPAVATLAPDAVSRVLAARVVGAATWLRIRDPDGRAGWAPAASLTVAVPPVAVRRVVERSADSLILRAGPDDGAPAREVLLDDDAVELLEKGPDYSLVIAAKSGRVGFVPNAVLGEALGERWWLRVEATASEGVARAAGEPEDRTGWVVADALSFDPSLLGVRARDERTLEVHLAPGVSLEVALRAFATPVMAPVPPRLVDEHGLAWALPATLATSGPYRLKAQTHRTLELERLTAAPDAPLRILLEVENEPLAALHRLRAGELDVLCDGLLPATLVPTLRRARDFVPGPVTGALVPPEVRGFDIGDPDLARLRVQP